MLSNIFGIANKNTPCVLFIGEDSKVTNEDLEGIIKLTKPSAPDVVMSQYLSFYAKYGQR